MQSIYAQLSYQRPQNHPLSSENSTVKKSSKSAQSNKIVKSPKDGYQNNLGSGGRFSAIQNSSNLYTKVKRKISQNNQISYKPAGSKKGKSKKANQPSISFDKDKAYQFINQLDSSDIANPDERFQINLNEIETQSNEPLDYLQEGDITDHNIPISKVESLKLFKEFCKLDSHAQLTSKFDQNILNSNNESQRSHEYLLRPQSTNIYYWGECQLGFVTSFDTSRSSSPKIFSLQIPVDRLACGQSHCLLLSLDGLLYQIGDMEGGRSKQQTREPMLIKSFLDQEIVDIASGDNHCLCLVKEADINKSCSLSKLPRIQNSIYTWGSNKYGQLGIGSQELFVEDPRSVQIHPLSDLNPIRVACGANHSSLLDELGRLFNFGLNQEGQCGIGMQQDFVLTPTKVTGISETIVKVACGNKHSIALTSKGDLFVMGSNQNGELGIGRNVRFLLEPKELQSMKFTRLIDICCGSFSAALSVENQFYVWGKGSFGEFYTPNRVKSFNKLDIRDFQISKSGASYVLTREGELYTWGSNLVGQLGLGDQEDRRKPTKIKKIEKISKIFLGPYYAMAVPLQQSQLQSLNEMRESVSQHSESETDNSKSVIFRENSSQLISIECTSASKAHPFGIDHSGASQDNASSWRESRKVGLNSKKRNSEFNEIKQVESKYMAKAKEGTKPIENLQDGLKQLARMAKEKQHSSVDCDPISRDQMARLGIHPATQVGEQGDHSISRNNADIFYMDVGTFQGDGNNELKKAEDYKFQERAEFGKESGQNQQSQDYPGLIVAVKQNKQGTNTQLEEQTTAWNSGRKSIPINDPYSSFKPSPRQRMKLDKQAPMRVEDQMDQQAERRSPLNPSARKNVNSSASLRNRNGVEGFKNYSQSRDIKKSHGTNSSRKSSNNSSNRSVDSKKKRDKKRNPNNGNYQIKQQDYYDREYNKYCEDRSKYLDSHLNDLFQSNQLTDPSRQINVMRSNESFEGVNPLYPIPLRVRSLDRVSSQYTSRFPQGTQETLDQKQPLKSSPDTRKSRSTEPIKPSAQLKSKFAKKNVGQGKTSPPEILDNSQTIRIGRGSDEGMNSDGNKSRTLSRSFELKGMVQRLLNENDDLEKKVEKETSLRQKLEIQMKNSLSNKAKEINDLNILLSQQEQEIDRLKIAVEGMQDMQIQHKTVKESLRQKLKETEQLYFQAIEMQKEAEKGMKEAQIEANQFKDDVMYLTQETELLIQELKTETEQKRDLHRQFQIKEGEYQKENRQLVQKLEDMDRDLEVMKQERDRAENKERQLKDRQNQYLEDQQRESERVAKLEDQIYQLKLSLDDKIGVIMRKDDTIQSQSNQITHLKNDLSTLRSHNEQLVENQNEIQIQIKNQISIQDNLRFEVERLQQLLEKEREESRRKDDRIRETNLVNQRLQQRIDQEVLRRAEIYQQKTQQILQAGHQRQANEDQRQDRREQKSNPRPLSVRRSLNAAQMDLPKNRDESAENQVIEGRGRALRPTSISCGTRNRSMCSSIQNEACYQVAVRPERESPLRREVSFNENTDNFGISRISHQVPNAPSDVQRVDQKQQYFKEESNNTQLGQTSGLSEIYPIRMGLERGQAGREKRTLDFEGQTSLDRSRQLIDSTIKIENHRQIDSRSATNQAGRRIEEFQEKIHETELRIQSIFAGKLNHDSEIRISPRIDRRNLNNTDQQTKTDYQGLQLQLKTAFEPISQMERRSVEVVDLDGLSRKSFTVDENPKERFRLFNVAQMDADKNSAFKRSVSASSVPTIQPSQKEAQPLRMKSQPPASNIHKEWPRKSECQSINSSSQAYDFNSLLKQRYELEKSQVNPSQQQSEQSSVKVRESLADLKQRLHEMRVERGSQKRVDVGKTNIAGEYIDYL